MPLDTDKIDAAALALLYLTPHDGCRAWKGMDWGVLGRRLSGPEIHQAYKRVAKRVHPDAGGNAREFQELSAARDALMKER